MKRSLALRPLLVDVLRHLHLLEPLRHVKAVGALAAARELRWNIFGAPDKLPLPPRRLHELIVGTDHLTTHDYLWIGRACAAQLADSLRGYAPSLRTIEPVLDFGCGCGRVMRHLWAAEPGLRVWGSDINREQVAWCRTHLPFEEAAVNASGPPLAFSDGTFGLAYAFSVFTHLPAELQRPWLAELVRVVRPGGYIFLSLHGAAYAAHYLPPGERSQFAAGHLIVHRPEDANVPDQYARCGAYHPPVYVTEQLAQGLRVLAHVPGESIDAGRRTIGQDLYLFRTPDVRA